MLRYTGAVTSATFASKGKLALTPQLIVRCRSVWRQGSTRARPLPCVLAAAPAGKPAAPTSRPAQISTAREAVEAGLAAFSEARDYDAAVRLFTTALELSPSSEEAAAALFNMGCAYAKQRKFRLAADAIGRAINEHDLKLSVALKVGGVCCAGAERNIHTHTQDMLRSCLMPMPPAHQVGMLSLS